MKKIDADDPMGRSADVAGDNFQRLRELFPEAFSEGHLDMQILRQLVGDLVVDEPTDASLPDEKYGLNWKGKRRARQLALTPSLGTLRPCPDESVDWDTTKNLMIEGDNLEVLKLLQKSFSGKVKLIYIDPPYNTGKDFVYPDNFHDNIRNYLELTGQVDGEGRRLTSNPESSGRFHTDWLNMMYPRLKLARNLLRDDGVLFMSLDDVEIGNARLLLDEVFGPENLGAQIVWKKRSSPDARDSIGSVHDYLLCYIKNREFIKDALGKLPLSQDRVGAYANPDNDPRGDWASVDMTGMTGRATKDQYFNIALPSGRIIRPPEGRSWGLAERTFIELRKDNRIWFGRDGNNIPRIKKFLGESDGQVIPSLWDSADSGSNDEGKKEINSLMGQPDVFDTPKPVSLVQRMIRVGSTSRDEDIVLDFFAGSGTTGHATMKMNADDGRNRRYILVQLPEVLDLSDKVQRSAADFCGTLCGPRTIAELTKERLRRASRKVREELLAKWVAEDAEAAKRSNGPGLFESGEDKPAPERVMPDLGFRVFKLETSNIRVWNPDPSRLGEELLANAEHVLPDRDDDDILYEMLLKLGLDLAAPMAERTIAGKKVVSIGNGALMACLEKEINASIVEDLAKGIAAWHAEQAPAGETTVFFRDSAFTDDVAKSNLTAILEQTFQGRKKDIRIRSI